MSSSNQTSNLLELAIKIFNQSVLIDTVSVPQRNERIGVLFSNITNCNNIDIFEILITVSCYGLKLLNIDPNNINDVQLDTFNRYAQIAGYKLNVQLNHDLAIPYCRLNIDITKYDLSSLYASKFFSLNKFHPLLLFEHTITKPRDADSYMNQISRIPDITCLSENKRFLFSFNVIY